MLEIDWNLFLLWFILLWLLHYPVFCTNKHFIWFCSALLCFPQSIPHTCIPLHFRRYTKDVHHTSVYSINNRLLRNTMALLFSYKWDQHQSTVHFKLLHSVPKPNSVSTWRHNKMAKVLLGMQSSQVKLMRRFLFLQNQYVLQILVVALLRH